MQSVYVEMRGQKLTLRFIKQGQAGVTSKSLIHAISLKLQIQFTLGKPLWTLDFAKALGDSNVCPKVFKIKHNSVSNSTHQV